MSQDYGVAFLLFCKKKKLEIEAESGLNAALLSYHQTVEYNLKLKDRLIAEQYNQISILNELSHKRNGDIHDDSAS